MKNIIAIYRGLVGYLGMTILGSLGILLNLITFGHTYNFNRTFLAPTFCRTILYLCGIKVENKIEIEHQGAVYFFNHNSFLDIFIIPTLGFKNTRFLISEKTKKILPLYLCNVALGAIFVPLKTDEDRRKQFFLQMEEWLEHNPESIVCSPEGTHTFKDEIAEFNSEVFIMSAKSQRKVCLLYFDIPKKTNPFESYYFESGTVKVHSLTLLETDNWNPVDIQPTVQAVRRIYIEEHRHRETYIF